MAPASKPPTLEGKASGSGSVGPRLPRAKARDDRDRLRAQGMRPIRIWVPDVRAPSFRAEAHRQAAAVAASAGTRDDQAFIDAVSDLGEE